MEHLKLVCFCRDDYNILTTLIEKLTFLPGLTSFQLINALINDTLVQAIFKNLLNLRDLMFVDPRSPSQSV